MNSGMDENEEVFNCDKAIKDPESADWYVCGGQLVVSKLWTILISLVMSFLHIPGTVICIGRLMIDMHILSS